MLKILGGISVLGACGLNAAMNFPNNEILIGLSIVVCSTSIAILPLSNELIVETTYPAGEVGWGHLPSEAKASKPCNIYISGWV